MKRETWSGFVLAIHTNAPGFGFAIMENPLSPVDWGVRIVRYGEKNAQCLKKVAALIEMQRPDIIVLEEISELQSQRTGRTRARALVRSIEKLAQTNSIEAYRYQHALVERCFATLGATTRYEMAEVIARHVPAFQTHLPPRRKRWAKEDPRMALFKAVALAFTFFAFDSGLQAPVYRPLDAEEDRLPEIEDGEE